MNAKRGLFLTIFLILSITTVFAQTNIYEFYSPGCPHCANVAESGILEELAKIENIILEQYDISTPVGYEIYSNFHNQIKMPRGVPLLVIKQDEELKYLVGDTPIIQDSKSLLEDEINYEQDISMIERVRCIIEDNFNHDVTEQGKLSTRSFSLLIVAALIDSINPCAFGVIIFLMISLLNLGSSKRALKAGLIYTSVIFITYFLAGLGLFAVIQSMTTIRKFIYLFVGIFVLGLSVVEFRDYIFAKKGKTSILKIPTKLKPLLEKYSKKGTLLAILILGVFVALFELPCTGGVYLAIITMLSQHVTASYIYLLIYNLIFVLPLIVITLLIYKGMSPERLQKWSTNERTWMKLGAAIIMLVLSVYLLLEPIKMLLGIC